MNWHGQASDKRGPSPAFSDQAIQFYRSIKCLFSLPLRHAMGMTQSLLQLAGLNWSVPNYSTRKNAKPWKTNRTGAAARNEILGATRRLGRTIWKK